METENSIVDIARLLRDSVLEPMKQAFVGKDEVIELLGVSLVARENLFILGPPGTAKSAIVQDMAKRIEGKVFDYLLTRFTEPNEIFGPFDIRQLKDGNLVTNTEGMLPEATFVFLDELLNANSAILNSLLMVLNERVFRRGREFRKLPTMMVVGASNNLPEDEALRALFDRFLLRVHCGNVPDGSLREVLSAGWKLESREDQNAAMSVEKVDQLQRAISKVQFGNVTEAFVGLVSKLRQAGIGISDRRAVKLQRMIAASSIMCGRLNADVTDLWVLRYIWDTVEQQEVINSIVMRTIEQLEKDPAIQQHALARDPAKPDPEKLARDLSALEQSVGEGVEVAVCLEQLAVLNQRIEWIENENQRTALKESLAKIQSRLEQKQPS